MTGRAKDVVLHVDYGDMLHLALNEGAHYGRGRIDRLMTLAAESGVTKVYWRVSMIGASNYPSQVRYQLHDPRACNVALDEPSTHTFTEIGKVYERVLEEGDPLQMAVGAAHRNDLELYAYVTLFDESYPGVESKFVQEHPECCWRHRYYSDKSIPGLLSYAYPEVVDYRLAELAELLTYEVDGIYYDTARTHSGVWDISGLPFGDYSPYWSYGFNDPEVAEYERRTGINPRLKSLADAVLPEQIDVLTNGQWDRLRGDYLTAYLRAASETIKGQGRNLAVGLYTDAACYLSPAGSRGRMPMGRFHHDWEGWSTEGLIDELVLIAGDHRRFGVDDWKSHSAAQFAAARENGLKVYVWAGTEYRIDEVPRGMTTPVPLHIEDDQALFLKTMEETLRRSYNLDVDGVFLHEAWDIEKYAYFDVLARAFA
jgi:uncharacterized lipoprotein YddW (UPF0748 family)